MVAAEMTSMVLTASTAQKQSAALRMMLDVEREASESQAIMFRSGKMFSVAAACLDACDGAADQL